MGECPYSAPLTPPLRPPIHAQRNPRATAPTCLWSTCINPRATPSINRHPRFLYWLSPWATASHHSLPKLTTIKVLSLWFRLGLGFSIWVEVRDLGWVCDWEAWFGVGARAVEHRQHDGARSAGDRIGHNKSSGILSFTCFVHILIFNIVYDCEISLVDKKLLCNLVLL